MKPVSDLPVFAPARAWLRGLPPISIDIALTVSVTVAQLWPFLTRDSPDGYWSWAGGMVVLATALPLLWRRRAPVLVLMVSLIATTFYDFVGPTPAQPVWYAGLVAIYTVAVRSARWPRWAMLAVTVGGSLWFTSSETALRTCVLFVAAYAIGRAAATSRSYAGALRERAERLEVEREAEAVRAAERERARIARDMHDILSHAVSVMVVQAEAGPVTLVTDPARAEAAFDTIASAGRDAMLQLRRILTVLQEDDGSRAPQPTIDALPRLAERAAAAGVSVGFSAAGVRSPVSPDVEIAAYRITQEAITNIIKHAGAGRAEVKLTWLEDVLVLDIFDNGRGAASSLPSGGHGLIGIRERAAACGGTVKAGPLPGRGFLVRAHLPLGARA